jgi:DNA-binding NarL/FixJ family response regulator
MIRLFIIEDHSPIIVPGLKRFFSSSRDGINVAGYCNTVEEAIDKGNEYLFDIFILDLWLENRLPLQNFRLLKNHFKDKPIVIYTVEMSSAWRRLMLSEGAVAYITKNASRSEIKKAIEDAYCTISF